MAKPKITAPKKVDIAQAAAQVEMPRIKWKIIGTVLLAFGVLWITALMMMPSFGYWGVGVVAALTLAALGLGVYVWRLTSKQREILEIMRAAQGEGGREAQSISSTSAPASPETK